MRRALNSVRSKCGASIVPSRLSAMRRRSSPLPILKFLFPRLPGPPSTRGEPLARLTPLIPDRAPRPTHESGTDERTSRRRSFSPIDPPRGLLSGRDVAGPRHAALLGGSVDAGACFRSYRPTSGSSKLSRPRRKLFPNPQYPRSAGRRPEPLECACPERAFLFGQDEGASRHAPTARRSPVVVPAVPPPDSDDH